MKEVWIHSGLPKNGSSAIQVFLAQNIANLEQEGIDYLEILDISDAKRGHISSGNAALLSRSMLNKEHEAFYDDNDNLYNQFLLQISSSKYEKILLSSEFFSVV